MVARRWSSRLSCGEHLLLRRDGNAQNSFLNKQRKYPSSRATRRKRGSSGCGRDPRASSRGETGENVLDFLKLWLMLSTYDGDERDRLWWPQDWNAQDSLLNKQRKDPSSRPTRRKRSSSGCGQDPRASSRVERGMSGNFLSCSKGVKDPLEVPQGLSPCVESGPEPEDSSPVLTWIVEYFRSLPRGSGDEDVGELLELQQGCEGPFGSSRV
ncbi:hypothetical protein MJT46_008897 [Ovis ammon polii x Ovis aries]|nr:hypothetical protein MJT46_008897 [Ovis ammon polii x Ovis aries]